jgi:hypothetical protein
MPTIYPPPGAIKSIQRGTTSSTVTISAVNVSKSRLTHTGAASISNNPANASLILTNSTTLTFNAGSLGSIPVVAWELTEFY